MVKVKRLESSSYRIRYVLEIPGEYFNRIELTIKGKEGTLHLWGYPTAEFRGWFHEVVGFELPRWLMNAPYLKTGKKGKLLWNFIQQFEQV